jgi:hypothetical protein
MVFRCEPQILAREPLFLDAYVLGEHGSEKRANLFVKSAFALLYVYFSLQLVVKYGEHGTSTKSGGENTKRGI